MNINPLDLLKNAQQIQEKLGEFQEKLGSLQATGAAGGGMVEIDLNGKFEVLAVRISPEVIEAGDTEMLQDLIKAAFVSAMDNIKDLINTEMAEVTGGLNIPGMAGGLPGFPGGFPFPGVG